MMIAFGSESSQTTCGLKAAEGSSDANTGSAAVAPSESDMNSREQDLLQQLDRQGMIVNEDGTVSPKNTGFSFGFSGLSFSGMIASHSTSSLSENEKEKHIKNRNSKQLSPLIEGEDGDDNSGPSVPQSVQQPLDSSTTIDGSSSSQGQVSDAARAFFAFLHAAEGGHTAALVPLTTMLSTGIGIHSLLLVRNKSFNKNNNIDVHINDRSDMSNNDEQNVFDDERQSYSDYYEMDPAVWNVPLPPTSIIKITSKTSEERMVYEISSLHRALGRKLKTAIKTCANANSAGIFLIVLIYFEVHLTLFHHAFPV
jgi:hypothetical protein